MVGPARPNGSTLQLSPLDSFSTVQSRSAEFCLCAERSSSPSLCDSTSQAVLGVQHSPEGVEEARPSCDPSTLPHKPLDPLFCLSLTFKFRCNMIGVQLNS